MVGCDKISNMNLNDTPKKYPRVLQTRSIITRRNLIRIICIILINFMLIQSNILASTITDNNDPERTRAPENDQSLVFAESSKGLPSTGEYNFITFGDFNQDQEIDIAFGGEDWALESTQGLYAYTGNGGGSWTSASDGLPTTNSWGGLKLGDADGDGYLELYATDEHWGTSTNSGLKVWEYRADSWSDSNTHVSTPLPFGQPNNVVLDDITGNSKLDLVICKRTGLDYYQNNGGNPVVWADRSDGLATTSEFMGLAVADINKDGLKDIVTSDYTGNEYIYIQAQTGDTWLDYSSTIDSGGITYGIDIGDVNDDSHMDIVFGNTDGGLLCWLGNSGGADGTDFQWLNGSTNLISNNIYNQLQLVDIDQDDDLDIIAPEGANGKGIQIYLGNGNTDPGYDIIWEKATKTKLPTNGYWYGVNCYDINDDGALDIVGASWGMGVRAYLNNINNNIELFNLHITADDITLEPESPTEGDDVIFNAKITNDGDWDTSEFTVEFLIDDEPLGPEDTIDNLKSKYELILNRTWVATEGPHNITVELEAFNINFETDDTDNTAEKYFTVQEKLETQDEKNESDESEFPSSLIIIVIIIVVIIIIVIILLLKRRKKSTEYLTVEAIDESEDD